MDFKPGDIVLSIAGRDKGNYFIVIDSEDNYVLMCDGDIRRTDKPKRKKCKHIRQSGVCDEFIRQKLEETNKATNRELRKCITRYLALNCQTPESPAAAISGGQSV